MKKLFTIIAALAITLRAIHAAPDSGAGPAVVKLNTIVLGQPFQQVGGKTNQSSTSTNITALYKSTIIKTAFDNAALLALLKNSFNTNFPAGSQIGLSLGNLFVVDSTGTNIIFFPEDVISFHFDESFISGVETFIETQNASGEHESGTVAENFTAAVRMNYDDTLKTTTDGTHTQFTFQGLYTVKASGALDGDSGKTTAVFQGTGGGPVRGIKTILNGTISGKVNGIPAG